MTYTSSHSPGQESARPGRRLSERARALADLESWYGGGERIPYDPRTRSVGADSAPYKVFVRVEGDPAQAVTFMPGFPDGSSGWANVLEGLPPAGAMSKIFVEYLGMGDSDSPGASYRYSTAERTDLVEALWSHLGVKSTILVAFDFSSLVVLEHLRRRLERAARGEAEGGPDIRGVFIFNGGLFTKGHSHPWWTTPLLSMPGGAMGPFFAGVSFPMFMMMGGVMWSSDFSRRNLAGHRVRESLRRRGGLAYLHRAAGFVADHKRDGKRLDFGAIFEAYRSSTPFLIGGSERDPFEHRQVDLTEKRLGARGCAITRLPGGHMTTDEEPKALAALIATFVTRKGAAGLIADADSKSASAIKLLK